MGADPPQTARRLPSWPARLAGAGVLVTLATALTLLYLSCPAYDDLYRAGIVRIRPWYKEVAWNYTTWSGRWSGIGLALLLLPRLDLFRWYPVLLMGAVVIQALGLRAFWRMLLGETAPRRAVQGLIATTMALMWAGLPSPAETWYWWTGGLENLVGIYLSLILIGALVRTRWEELGRRRARAAVVGLALLALFVTGLHEVSAMLLCLVLMCGTAIVFKSGQPTLRRRVWLTVFLCALIGFGIVVLAPGNFNRAAYFNSLRPESKLRLSHTLELIRDQAFAVVPWWVLDLRLLSATTVLVLSPFFVRARAGGLRWGGIPPRLVISTAWILGIAAMFVATISAMHKYMFPRTLGTTYTFFVLGWLALVYAATRAKAGSADSGAKALEAVGPRLARSVALVVLGLSLMLTGNTREGVLALWEGAPQTWSRIMHWRDRSMREAARAGATEFVWPMNNLAGVYRAKYPRVFIFHDMAEDPAASDDNGHSAIYYNLKSVRRMPRRAWVAAQRARKQSALGLKPDDATTTR